MSYADNIGSLANNMSRYVRDRSHRATLTTDAAVLLLLSMTLALGVEPSGSVPADALTYHFLHANIFHLLANVYALLMFRPRLKTCAVAYVSATAAYIVTAVIAHHVPCLAPLIPSAGMSGFVFAAWARKYASWKWPIWKPVVLNTALAFVPHFNWLIHIMSFLISYLIWRLLLRHGTERK